MKNKIVKMCGLTVLLFGVFLLSVGPVFAHMVVQSGEVVVGTFQTFTISVPNEGTSPTTAIWLLVPDGMGSVLATVKPGWTISVKKQGEGEDQRVTEISWTGGSIPVGQRDDFSFSAQVPPEETTLQWKAYQSYADGTVVSWDEDPARLKNMTQEEKDKMERVGKGPYSETKIVNELTSSNKTNKNIEKVDGTSSKLPLLLSGGAFLFSLIAMGMVMKKK